MYVYLYWTIHNAFLFRTLSLLALFVVDKNGNGSDQVVI